MSGFRQRPAESGLSASGQQQGKLAVCAPRAQRQTVTRLGRAERHRRFAKAARIRMRIPGWFRRPSGTLGLW